MARSTDPRPKPDLAAQERQRRDRHQWLNEITFRLACMPSEQRQQLEARASALRSRYRSHYG